MIEGIYNFLGQFGFHHPLHPLVVHVPMGMIIGAVAFSLAAYMWPSRHFDQTAYHCIVLALISIVPVYLIGLIDWQHVFGGDWIKWIIIKMILGAILALVLAFAVIQKNRGASKNKMFIIYLVAFALCSGLGYSGGELVWGG